MKLSGAKLAFFNLIRNKEGGMVVCNSTAAWPSRKWAFALAKKGLLEIGRSHERGMLFVKWTGRMPGDVDKVDDFYKEARLDTFTRGKSGFPQKVTVLHPKAIRLRRYTHPSGEIRETIEIRVGLLRDET